MAHLGIKAKEVAMISMFNLPLQWNSDSISKSLFLWISQVPTYFYKSENEAIRPWGLVSQNVLECLFYLSEKSLNKQLASSKDKCTEIGTIKFWLNAVVNKDTENYLSNLL